MRLIVTADDLGWDAARDQAILRAARDGIVTSASVLMTGRSVAGLTVPDGLCLGLHLGFVQGPALAAPDDAPSLVDRDGALPRDVFRLARAVASARDLRREAEAQLSAFVARFGVPAFVNTHQHAQLLPSVRRVVLGLCRDHRIPRIRLPAEQRPFRLGVRPRAVFWPIATGLALASRRAYRQAGLRFPDRMVGGPDSGGLTTARLKSLIAALDAPTTELVVHPTVGPELDALLDSGVLDLLERRKVERIPFDVL